MLKVIEEISNRVLLSDGLEADTEGYRLENGLEVQYIGGKWVDPSDNEYTPVSIPSTDSTAKKRIIGFVRRDTLNDVDKELLRRDPEGAAYVEYERRVGGEQIGLSVPTGYPSRVQAYLDEGGSLEGLYRELTELGVTWYEYFSTYPVELSEGGELDLEYAEVYW